LAELLDIAIKRNPQLAVQRAKVGEARMQVFASGLLPNPFVAGGYKKEEGQGNGPLFEISQELPINGVLGLERSQAQLLHDAEQARLLREIQVILSSVKEAYVGVLLAQDASAVEKRNVQTVGESLANISERFRVGLVAEMPRTIARADLATAKVAASQAERNIAVARQRLARLLGMEEGALPPVAGTLRTSLLPPGLDPSKCVRPDLQALSLEARAAQTDIAASERGRIPNPKITYSREEVGPVVEHFINVGVDLPILNTGVPKVRRSISKYETVRAEQAALNNQIKAEREQAALNLSKSQETVQIYDTEIAPALASSLAAAKAAFQSGTTDVSLLLETQARLIEKDRGILKNLEDLRKAELEYLLALGVSGR
jgi:cobalt-zinc-cadmium efflux system outer membrane protein